MKRNIIKVHEEKCIGCGLCVSACAEGALQLIDGKAKLVSDSYCDGLGKCLPSCPVDAIEVIERDADEFDKEAAEVHKIITSAPAGEASGCGCPGTEAKTITREPEPVSEPSACGCPGTHTKTIDREPQPEVVSQNQAQSQKPQSELQQWPVQIKLVPANAPYLQNAHLLIAADCTAFAYANIHEDFMKNKVTIIGCPKLDEGDYADKFTDILKYNDIKSVTVLRMEVPCCGGIENSTKQALINSGKMIPWSVVTISTDGKILDI